MKALKDIAKALGILLAFFTAVVALAGCQTIGKAVEQVPTSWWEKALEGAASLIL